MKKHVTTPAVKQWINKFKKEIEQYRKVLNKTKYKKFFGKNGFIISESNIYKFNISGIFCDQSLPLEFLNFLDNYRSPLGEYTYNESRNADKGNFFLALLNGDNVPITKLHFSLPINLKNGLLNRGQSIIPYNAMPRIIKSLNSWLDVPFFYKDYWENFKNDEHKAVELMNNFLKSSRENTILVLAEIFKCLPEVREIFEEKFPDVEV